MTDFTHSLAVVIGIDAYGGGIPPLTTAVNDAMRPEYGQSAALGGRSRRTSHFFEPWNPNMVGTRSARLLR
ncbi:MAG: hypothetical protein HZY76_12060 [Anaerolineae bacterium]|nr:MAG: hypothetical protein HZY76_12060 [Anaerolineae bacterium]